MSELNVQLCPETGICSIIKEDGKKIDLMPDEVINLREASGNADVIKKALAAVDSTFAGTLDDNEITQVANSLK